MTTRRLIMILGVLVVVAAVGLGIFWLVRRNTGPRLMERGQLAMQARNYDKALDLFTRYVAKYPQDWMGFYKRGETLLRLGRYVDSREPLNQAIKLAPEQSGTWLALGDSYSLPARKDLSAETTAKQPPELRALIEQLAKANEVISQAKLKEKKDQLDIQQYVGLDVIQIGLAYQALSRNLAKEAERAESNKMADMAKSYLKESELAAGKYDTSMAEAMRTLLAVLTEDPSRERSALALIQLCQERNDTATLDKVRTLVMSIASPPPVAAMRLAVEELRAKSGQLEPGAMRHLFAEKAELLDKLLKEHPDEMEVKLMRAELALVLNDLPTAEKLADEVLKVDARQAQARMIHASVQFGKSNVAAAEQELWRLVTDFPRWPRAQFAYGKAAMAVGKTGLALDALRACVRLDPGNLEANKALASLSMKDPSSGQGMLDAKKSYEAKPNDPDAIRIFVDALKRADQVKDARDILIKAEKENPTRPEILMAVVQGYVLLDDSKEAARVTKLITDLKSESVEGQIAVARSLMVTGRASEAEKILADQLAKTPNEGTLCFELGRLYSLTNRTVQAVELFRRALQSNPANPTLRVALAKSLFDVGDLDECASVLEQVDASNPTANLLRAQLSLIQGKPVDTKLLLTQIEQGKQSGLPLAMLYLNTGKAQECVDVCEAEMKRYDEKTAASDPTALDVRSLLGQAYLTLGQKDKCLETWKAVLTASPSRVGVYLQLASVLGATEEPAQVAADLAKIPGAQQELVDLTTAWLYTRLNKADLARLIYERLATAAKTSEAVRQRARLLMADSLAKENRVDDAMAQLDELAKEKGWQKQASEAKARLLVAAKRYKDASAILADLTKGAVEEKNGALLERVVGLYAEMKQADDALAVCDKMKVIMPDDVRSYLLRAAVQRAQGKTEDMIVTCRQALAIQPTTLEIYQALARALDSLGRPQEALAELQRLEAVSQAGKATAYLERGAMFARWGLQAPAADCFQKLAQMGFSNNAQLQLSLGQALAALGQKDAARDVLRKITTYAPQQYLPAQQILAELEPTPEAKLALVRQLAKTRPDSGDVLLQELSLLTRAKNYAEAVKTFKDFAKDNKQVPAQAAPMVVPALIETGDRAEAAGLCLTIAQQSNNTPQWRLVGILLILDDKPQDVEKILAAPANAALYDALLGVCLAVKTNRPDLAKAYQARVVELDQLLNQANPPQSVASKYKIMADLASGVIGQANTELANPNARIDVTDLVVVKELADGALNNPKLAQEAAALLKASLADELGIPAVGRAWAMEALKARPTFQWAADVAAHSQADAAALRQILEILQPKDGVLAHVIQANLAMEEKKYDQALQEFIAASKAGDGKGFLMNQAMALERAGRLKEAMDLYEKVYLATKHPIAANNAAYLVAVLCTSDSGKLAAAQKWMEEAIKAAPNVGAFHDTFGWIAFLRNDKETALPNLWQAVRDNPNSVENHYHVGMAEAAAGHTELGKWHLQAALAVGDKFKQDGQEISPSTADILRQAAQALEKLK